MRQVLVLLGLAACGTSTAAAVDAASDAVVAADAGKDAMCASTFGAALTNAFGRVDGTVVAFVPPGDARCAVVNSDHAVVQVLMGGAVYRLVVNVQDSVADPTIQMRTVEAALPAPAFADGWHTGVKVDYVADLQVHSTDAAWQSRSTADATAAISDELEVGAPISIYATSTGGAYASSAHLIHRTTSGQIGQDGAIVVGPTSAHPRWLLFSFRDQTF